ncbi:MAG: nucleotidyltransferase [Terrimicrobiaceae bacterium]
MADGPFDPETGELIPRDPTLEDLVALCRELNNRGAQFMVVGGFAIRATGLARNTGDVDVLMDVSPENERRVFEALATLPDGCVRELDPGDVAKYTVVRVADEILVDLMASASGITYEEAAKSVIVHEIDGVDIPFASPELLYRMKKRAGREKDRGDIYFLEQLFAAQGLPLPEV